MAKRSVTFIRGCGVTTLMCVMVHEACVLHSCDMLCLPELPDSV